MLGTLAWLAGVASGLLTTIGIVVGLVAAAALNIVWYTGVAFPLLLALVFGSAAMILGSMGMRRVSSGYASNRGAALTGIVFGVVTTGFVFLAGFIFIAVVIFDAA